MSTDREKLVKQRNLQAEILARFMSKEELDAFLAKYEKHKKTSSSATRLLRPLTDKEKVALDLYFSGNPTLESPSEYAKENGISYWAVIQRARGAALRLLYQNKDEWKIKELLAAGGEVNAADK